MKLMIRARALVVGFFSNRQPTLQQSSPFNMGIKYLNLTFERDLGLTIEPDKRERDTSMELSRSFDVLLNLSPVMLTPHVQRSSA